MSYGKASQFIREEAKRGSGKDGNISEKYFYIIIFNALVKFYTEGMKRFIENHR